MSHTCGASNPGFVARAQHPARHDGASRGATIGKSRTGQGLLAEAAVWHAACLRGVASQSRVEPPDIRAEPERVQRMSTRVLVAEPDTRSGRAAAPRVPDARGAWSIAAALGAALALIGWTDVLLVWLPFRPTGPEWEFGAISATFAGMPLGTLGLGILAAAAAARGWRRTLRALAVLCWLLTATVAVLAVIYALDAVVAWRGAPAHVGPALTIAVLKSAAFAMTYMALYPLLGVLAWRSSRRPILEK